MSNINVLKWHQDMHMKLSSHSSANFIVKDEEPSIDFQKGPRNLHFNGTELWLVDDTFDANSRVWSGNYSSIVNQEM